MVVSSLKALESDSTRRVPLLKHFVVNTLMVDHYSTDQVLTSLSLVDRPEKRHIVVRSMISKRPRL